MPQLQPRWKFGARLYCMILPSKVYRRLIKWLAHALVSRETCLVLILNNHVSKSSNLKLWPLSIFVRYSSFSCPAYNSLNDVQVAQIYVQVAQNDVQVAQIYVQVVQNACKWHKSMW